MKDRKLSRWASECVLALALAGISAPLAQAGHAPAKRDLGTAAVGRPDAATRHHHPEAGQSPTRIIAVARADGFDWGDAGIGAAGGVGAVLLAGGSALFLRRNIQPRRALRRA